LVSRPDTSSKKAANVDLIVKGMLYFSLLIFFSSVRTEYAQRRELFKENCSVFWIGAWNSLFSD
ncbi:hypothetical protein, partial [Oleiphilus sp. HI0079]|uniref:hypothetical protein n=1 Tax=Oleiphilus sp. HI0079 TaxID=1822254 RepID=UPI001E4F397E